MRQPPTKGLVVVVAVEAEPLSLLLPPLSQPAITRAEAKRIDSRVLLGVVLFIFCSDSAFWCVCELINGVSCTDGAGNQ